MPMGRPLSDQPLGSKSSKRKGTRSVSTLTPSQLARKRANDREAQRAIRARTKEYIERLERELEELRSDQNCDRTLQDLLRRNKVLKEELSRLRGLMGMSMARSPYSADYKPFPDYDQRYFAMFGSSLDSWAANDPSHLGFDVSSSSSSTDDYVSVYIPISLPTMVPTVNSR